MTWTRCAFLLSCVVLATLCGGGPSYAEVRSDGQRIVFTGESYRMSFDARSGALTSVTAAKGEQSLWQSGEYGLWSAQLADGTVVSATQASCTSVVADEAVEFRYQHPALEVTVQVKPLPHGLELSADLTSRRSVVLEFALPARLRFDPGHVSRFVSPANGNASVGYAFTGEFFRPQPTDHPSGWEHSRAAGPKAYARLFGGPLEQRPDRDAPVPLNVSDAGRVWLGQALADRLAAAKATVNRPFGQGQCDLSLVESANGTFFGGASLGGAGKLWRVGGSVSQTEAPLIASVVEAAVRRLVAEAPDTRAKVGLVSLANGPASGGWCAVTVEEWASRLRRAAGGQAKFVTLDTVADLQSALESDEFLAVLNPYGEWCPVGRPGGMEAMVDAIGAFVRAGGHWFEVGGHPFYYELTPLRHYTYGSPFPPAFADFFHLEGEVGTAAVYRVQPRRWAPWSGKQDHTSLFVPGRLQCGSDEHGGYCDRPFGAHVSPGETWRCPVVRLTVGDSAAESLRAYARLNGVDRPLSDKVRPEVLDRLRGAVLLYYGGTAKEKLAHLHQLPAATLVHFADYLKGGFDKEYPDHLPPHPSFGTADELKELFRQCAARGHLIMPYTNPTWWCDHPRGLTFLGAGEAPLLRRLDGKLSHEQYGAAGNDGWTICHWHPAAQAANRETVRQFTEDYPVDVLFQDQCGARHWRYDANPASPTPTAYTEGLLSMVEEDCRRVPLSTEGGWAGVVNAETQLCGMSFEIVPTEGGPPWRKLYKTKVPPALWRIFPVAQYLAHDKCLMNHHDLGQFVTNRQVLSWTLGLGFCLSQRVSATSLSHTPTREWLAWLDRLQKSVCARYVGEPVVSFEHRRPAGSEDGVISATYGPVQLVANLEAATYRDEETQRVLAAYGFRATGPGFVAGDLASEPAGPAGEGAAFVTQRSAGRLEAWVYARSEEPVVVELPTPHPATVRAAFDGAPAREAVCQQGMVAMTTPALPGQERVQPPVQLAATPPVRWPQGKPVVGVLELPGVAPTWTDMGPAEWLEALRASPLVTELGVEVLPLTSESALAQALSAGAMRWLAILNPYGENFPVLGPQQWQETLTAIRRYVSQGGNWWETGGYSFHSAVWHEGERVTRLSVGPRGMAFLGLPVGSGEVDQAPEALHVTSAGRAILGEAVAERVETLASSVNRSLGAGGVDPGHLALVTSDSGDFIGGYRFNGWGWLWRIGGFHPNPEVVVPVVTATLKDLYTNPPRPLEASGPRHLWHAVLTP